MKVLITLGPTQEPLDAIRFITNASSGKMGLALAGEALSRGHNITLVTGPIQEKIPEKFTLYRIRTASEMIQQTLQLAQNYDIFISTAAIADYSPEEVKEGKIPSEEEELVLRLKRNPKLTKLAREKFSQLFIVAFKAEYDVSEKALIDSGRKKLEGEDLNMVVANDLEKAIGLDETEVWILTEKDKKHIAKSLKTEAAKKIWDAIEETFYHSLR